MEEWDRVAWICAHQPRMSKTRLKFEDFHPLRKGEELSPEDRAARIRELKKGMASGLTDAERQARFKQFWRRQDNDGRK